MTNILWQPSTSHIQRRQRAELYKVIRRFFDARGVLEVTTPQLASSTAWEPHLDSILCDDAGTTGYLQTSPEQHMKRLLCAGSDDIYQICQAFRAGEQGSQHNREFTIAEWYRQGQNFETTIAESCQLLTECAPEITTPIIRHTYSSLYQQYLDIDLYRINCLADISSKNHLIIQAIIAKLSADNTYASISQNSLHDMTTESLMDYAFAQLIQPQLQQPTLVTEFPTTSAAMAKIATNSDGITYAKRFEIYWQGLEILNGYDELTDVNQLAKRYSDDNLTRHAMHKSTIVQPAWLFDAMHHGLPACCGVAMGIDRLLMCITKATHIAEVVSFTANNA